MLIKKIVLITALLLFLTNFVNAKIGIDILPVKCVNEMAANSGNDEVAINIIENEFADDLKRFSVRKSMWESLEQLQLQIAGLVKETDFKGLAEVNYFVISDLWEDEEIIIFKLRVMNAENCKIVYANGFSEKRKVFKNALERLAAETKKSIVELVYDKKTIRETKSKINITVFEIEESGKDGLAEITKSEFLYGLKRTGEFNVIEREEAKYAVQEKVVIAAGLINRNPLKKFGRIYNIDLAIEGYVITKNEGIIGYDIKVIDVPSAKLLFQIYDECYGKEEMRDKIWEMAHKVAIKYFRKLSKLQIATSPSGASIFINGRYWGANTPNVLTDIEEGNYDILLKKLNYDNYKKNVTLKVNKIVKLNIKLKQLDLEFFIKGQNAQKRKKWQIAIKYYKEFLESYPDVKESIQAKFRIAHIYHYQFKQYSNAITAYRELVKSYFGIDLVSESMYGLGCCLIAVKKNAEGKEILNKLIADYPETTAARYAKKKLR